MKAMPDTVPSPPCCPEAAPARGGTAYAQCRACPHTCRYLHALHQSALARALLAVLQAIGGGLGAGRQVSSCSNFLEQPSCAQVADPSSSASARGSMRPLLRVKVKFESQRSVGSAFLHSVLTVSVRRPQASLVVLMLSCLLQTCRRSLRRCSGISAPEQVSCPVQGFLCYSISPLHAPTLGPCLPMQSSGPEPAVLVGRWRLSCRLCQEAVHKIHLGDSLCSRVLMRAS